MNTLLRIIQARIDTASATKQVSESGQTAHPWEREAATRNGHKKRRAAGRLRTAHTLYVLCMGTWGVAIFSSDTAADVRSTYRELLEDGYSDADASAEVLNRFKEAVNDPDDGPLLWTGLAAAQQRLGRLQSDVRDRAIAVVDAGADLHLWDDRKLREPRRLALAKLRAELLGPQRERVAVRRPRRKPSPVAKGQVFLLRLDDGREARFNVIGMEEHRMGDLPILQLIDDRGRTYRRRLELLGKVDWPRAQFEIVPPRWSDLPTSDEIRVVGAHGRSVPLEEARSYTSWRLLREIVQQLIDDPERGKVE